MVRRGTTKKYVMGLFNHVQLAPLTHTTIQQSENIVLQLRTSTQMIVIKAGMIGRNKSRGCKQRTQSKLTAASSWSTQSMPKFMKKDNGMRMKYPQRMDGNALSLERLALGRRINVLLRRGLEVGRLLCDDGLCEKSEQGKILMDFHVT